jgi:hypothetical protein
MIFRILAQTRLLNPPSLFMKEVKNFFDHYSRYKSRNVNKKYLNRRNFIVLISLRATAGGLPADQMADLESSFHSYICSFFLSAIALQGQCRCQSGEILATSMRKQIGYPINDYASYNTPPWDALWFSDGLFASSYQSHLMNIGRQSKPV